MRVDPFGKGLLLHSFSLVYNQPKLGVLHKGGGGGGAEKSEKYFTLAECSYYTQECSNIIPIM